MSDSAASQDGSSYCGQCGQNITGTDHRGKCPAVRTDDQPLSDLHALYALERRIRAFVSSYGLSAVRGRINSLNVVLDALENPTNMAKILGTEPGRFPTDAPNQSNTPKSDAESVAEALWDRSREPQPSGWSAPTLAQLDAPLCPTCHGDFGVIGCSNSFHLGRIRRNSLPLTTHPFVSTPNSRNCSSCGLPRQDTVHNAPKGESW